MKYSLDVVDITLSSSEDDETYSEQIDKCTQQVKFSANSNIMSKFISKRIICNLFVIYFLFTFSFEKDEKFNKCRLLSKNEDEYLLFGHGSCYSQGQIPEQVNKFKF